MDILYVIGKSGPKNHLELRMSLRSICKYGKNIGNVIVAGFIPDWLSDEVVKIPIGDKYSYKHSNILRCIENVVDMGIVDGDFLYSSDDHFYCKDVDFDNYPYYIKGNLRNYVAVNDPYYRYHKSLYDTRCLLTKYGYPTKNYSQHCNTHMSSDIIKEIKELIHESYNLPFGAEPTSLIMNVWQTKENPPPIEHRDDMKILHAECLAEIRCQLNGRECFSIGNRAATNTGITMFFNEEYSYPCIFEKH